MGTSASKTKMSARAVTRASRSLSDSGTSTILPQQSLADFAMQGKRKKSLGDRGGDKGARTSRAELRTESLRDDVRSPATVAPTTLATTAAQAEALADNATMTLRERFTSLGDMAEQVGVNSKNSVVVTITDKENWKDILWALCGSMTYALTPTAAMVVSQRNIDLNGGVGAATSLAFTTLIGALGKNVPFIAGGMAACALHTAYVVLDEPVIEPIFGMRLNRWAPALDATLADGIYENQPMPEHRTINNHDAVVYSDDAMQAEFANGERIIDQHSRGESVNSISDGISDGDEPQTIRDGAGNLWLADDIGGFYLCDEERIPVQDGNGNLFYQKDGALMMTDWNGTVVEDHNSNPQLPAATNEPAPTQALPQLTISDTPRNAFDGPSRQHSLNYSVSRGDKPFVRGSSLTASRSFA